MTFEVDSDYITGILSRLVQTPSVNPGLINGGSGEAEVATYIAQKMRDLGLTVEVTEVSSGRPNIVGRLSGSGGGKRLLLNAHMDTVGVDEMADPFGGNIVDGKLYGRGAYDMKGGLAAMMGAVKAINDAGLNLSGDLLVTAVCDEEYASIGADALVGKYSADGAIVTEPTDLAICRAHRGFIWYEVVTSGRAAHGSRYNEGIDANMRMGRFLAELDRLEKALRARTPHPLLGTPSLHASTLQGGTAFSVYAASCKLQLERRTLPDEEQSEITATLEAIASSLSSRDETFQAEISTVFARSPFEISQEANIVATVQAASSRYLKRVPAHIGQTYWTDAAILADAGMETVIIGPKGHGLHSKEEWVDVESVVTLAGILAESARLYCGETS